MQVEIIPPSVADAEKVTNEDDGAFIVQPLVLGTSPKSRVAYLCARSKTGKEQRAILLVSTATGKFTVQPIPEGQSAGFDQGEETTE